MLHRDDGESDEHSMWLAHTCHLSRWGIVGEGVGQGTSVPLRMSWEERGSTKQWVRTCCHKSLCTTILLVGAERPCRYRRPGDDEEDWRGSGALKSLPGTDDKWRDTQRGRFTVTRPPSRGVNQPSPGYFAYKNNFPHHEREQDRMADEVRTALERRLIPC